MKLRRFALLPLVLLAFAFAACGGDDGGSGSDGGTQDPAALEGESWILTQMLTAGGQTEIVQTGVSAEFDGIDDQRQRRLQLVSRVVRGHRERDLLRSDRRDEEDLSRG